MKNRSRQRNSQTSGRWPVVAVIDGIDAAHRFLAGLSSITSATRSDVRATRLAADSFIALHHFEKAQRVAHGVYLTNLVGVNSRDWH